MSAQDAPGGVRPVSGQLERLLAQAEEAGESRRIGAVSSRLALDDFLYDHGPTLARLLVDAMADLKRLQSWDMLTLTPEGKGMVTADAPWARQMIDALLARFAEVEQQAGEGR